MPLASRASGGYEIVALIGAGGMGEVYRARDARLGRSPRQRRMHGKWDPACAHAGFRFETVQAETTYDVTADGCFIVLCDPEASAPASVTVVVNWQTKLR